MQSTGQAVRVAAGQVVDGTVPAQRHSPAGGGELVAGSASMNAGQPPANSAANCSADRGRACIGSAICSGRSRSNSRLFQKWMASARRPSSQMLDHRRPGPRVQPKERFVSADGRELRREVGGRQVMPAEPAVVRAVPRDVDERGQRHG